MKVAPVSEIPQHLSRKVPHIYISRDPCKHIEFDVTLLGDCDSVVAELCRRTGWDLRHPMVNETEYEVKQAEGDTEGVWRVISKGSTSVDAVAGGVSLAGEAEASVGASAAVAAE
jgi:NAD-dependent histone deacetylase SIR2